MTNMHKTARTLTARSMVAVGLLGFCLATTTNCQCAQKADGATQQEETSLLFRLSDSAVLAVLDIGVVVDAKVPTETLVQPMATAVTQSLEKCKKHIVDTSFTTAMQLSFAVTNTKLDRDPTQDAPQTGVELFECVQDGMVGTQLTQLKGFHRLQLHLVRSSDNNAKSNDGKKG